jgi:Dak1 domain
MADIIVAVSKALAACITVSSRRMQVAGAAAQRGLPLEQVRAHAQHAADGVASMGAALSACTLPGAAPSEESRLPAGMMELGLGIHGEPGAQRCEARGASGTVRALLERILRAERGSKGRAFQAGDTVALLVNNLGATTHMELAIVARAALQQLHGVGSNAQQRQGTRISITFKLGTCMHCSFARVLRSWRPLSLRCSCRHREDRQLGAYSLD